MTSHALAANAYSGAARTLGTPRDVEYQAFQRVIAMMNVAKDTNAAFARVAEAVHMNNRLWAALASDVASTRNGLPADLRAQLFSIAEFSRKHGNKILGKEVEASEGLDDLITVNTAIMRGLKGEASAAPNGG